MGVKLGRAKYQPSTSRGTFLNWGLNEGGKKNVRFQRKTGHIVGARYPKNSWIAETSFVEPIF